MAISKIISKAVGDKRRWRRYKARAQRLPTSHRTAIEAIERYLMHVGPGPADGENAASMFEDLIDLFEQAAADGTPVRAVVGDDPVEFIESFVQSYARGGYIDRERSRLVESIARAEQEDRS